MRIRIIMALLALALASVGGCQRDPAPPGVAMQSNDSFLAGPDFYRDVTSQTGINFTYRTGEETGHYAILESLGGGVGLIDFDRDGLLDIFALGGGFYDGPEHQTIKGYPCKLFKNRGDFHFEDVTAAVGLERVWPYTHGCAVGDYDNDGWPDLLVTGWGGVLLFHNVPADAADPQRGRKFEDVTQAAGLTDPRWSTSAAWADLDGDGFADLYICHYVDWSFTNNPKCPGYSSKFQRDVCPPGQFKGLPDVVYRNNRNGTFTDMSAQANLRQSGDPAGDAGKGLGVVISDLNGDGRNDIYVANDTVDNFLYLNRGSWKLEEVGMLKGVARDEGGIPQGSMGVDIGDYDGSGRPAIFVTNYENEMHALYRNLGKNELFLFSTTSAGISAIGQRYVGFGTHFSDVNHDGWNDLVIINGHVIRHPVQAGLAQRPVLFLNRGQGKFSAATPRGGDYFKSDHRGRGSAIGDLDNDGWPDLVVSHVLEPLAILKHTGAAEAKQRHWLGVELVPAKPRDLVGARIVLEAGGRKQTAFLKGGGSYLSASDTRHVFGLADAATVERLSVTWPNGRTQEWSGSELAVDRYWKLMEGEQAAR